MKGYGPLYMVILFDPRIGLREFKFHNLSEESAKIEQGKLTRMGQPAFFLPQSCTHLSVEAGYCQVCNHEVNKALTVEARV
jgi:hypothetical protein